MDAIRQPGATSGSTALPVVASGRARDNIRPSQHDAALQSHTLAQAVALATRA